MTTGPSILFDARFLNREVVSGIARDSKAVLNQFLKNKWSVKLLEYKGAIVDIDQAMNLPSIQSKKSLVRATAEAIILKKHLNSPNSESRVFYLSQVSPLKIKTKYSKSKRVIRVHDLFPVTNPEWFTQKAVLHFRAGLSTIDKNDILISNSKTTTALILDVLGGRISPSQIREIPCQVTDFGSRVACTSCEACINPTHISNYFLAVGTIEPRKNYFGLIAAWQIAQSKDLGYKLVIVGNLGWNSKASASKLDVQKSIIFLKGICDYQLHILYQNAFGFISASFNEGFNIPLLEAQNIGSRLILSNINIHHEFVSKHAAKWFNPREVDSIADALNQSMKIPTKNLPTRSTDSFDRSFEQLSKELQEMWKH